MEAFTGLVVYVLLIWIIWAMLNDIFKPKF